MTDLVAESIERHSFLVPSFAPDKRVRVLGTDGNFYRVPEEHVAEAVEAGGRVMGPEEMRVFRQQVFMEHGLFEERGKRPLPQRKQRLVKSRRRGR